MSIAFFRQGAHWVGAFPDVPFIDIRHCVFPDSGVPDPPPIWRITTGCLQAKRVHALLRLAGGEFQEHRRS